MSRLRMFASSAVGNPLFNKKTKQNKQNQKQKTTNAGEEWSTIKQQKQTNHNKQTKNKNK
jgi:hypothetical protein